MKVGDRVEITREAALWYGPVRRGVIKVVDYDVQHGHHEYIVLLDGEDKPDPQWFLEEDLRPLTLLELIAEAAQ